MYKGGKIMDKCCCNTGKTKHRDNAEYKALITRLNKN